MSLCAVEVAFLHDLVPFALPHDSALGRQLSLSESRTGGEINEVGKAVESCDRHTVRLLATIRDRVVYVSGNEGLRRPPAALRLSHRSRAPEYQYT